MPPADIFSDAYAKDQDAADPLKHLREQFHIPTRGQLKRTTLEGLTEPLKKTDVESSTYLCGNSLGCQPRLVTQYSAAYHETWATKGVYGHFKQLDDSPLAPWLHVDDDAVPGMAALVGAQKDEVAVMQTLTANLHLALLSFYRPTKDRYKIILESKAFPSDHYAIESQIRHHNLSPNEAMISIDPSSPTGTLTTSDIISTIDAHASTTALLLLPGVQFYTGQFFDIPHITAHAHSKGITVGWDLAHAVANVPLSLHDWNVDFAAWCTYKYLNCGPGAIAGLFVHNRHSRVKAATASEGAEYTPRLAGWWGSSKNSRFSMTNTFEPIEGAAGWQLSNPSVADLTNVRASLDVFALTDMRALREKSVKLTGYLEGLLDLLAKDLEGAFQIITPREPEQRGAQLSVRLAPGLLEGVLVVLEEEGVVVDERKPDVIRVAPAPMYNTFKDVLRFVTVFGEAIRKTKGNATGSNGSVMAGGGKDDKGWSEIK